MQCCVPKWQIPTPSSPPDLGVVALEGPRRAQAKQHVEIRASIAARGLDRIADLPIDVLVDDQPVAAYVAEVPASNDARVELTLPLDVELGEDVDRATVTVRVPRREGEVNVSNNARSLSIDVVGEKPSVLVLDGAPRWGHRYLRDVLESAKDIDASILTIAHGPDRRLPGAFPGDREALFEFDVIVLGDIDSGAFSRDELASLHDFVAVRGGGLVLVAGPSGMPYSFEGTEIERLLPVELVSPPPALADRLRAESKEFRIELTTDGETADFLRLDSDRERNRSLWLELPALWWRCPVAGARGGATTHATRHGTSEELIVAREVGAGRVLFVGTDELWRWRFRIGEEVYAKLWRGIIAWSTDVRFAGGDGSIRLHVDTRDAAERDGEIVVSALAIGVDGKPLPHGALVDAELTRVARDGAPPARRIRLESVEGGGGLFRGHIATGEEPGALPAGTYSLRVVSPALPDDYDERPDRATATFDVEAPPSPELESARRDTELLARLATSGASGGRAIGIEEFDSLPSRLPGKPIEIEKVASIDQWMLSWPLMALLASLLTVEWVLRGAERR